MNKPFAGHFICDAFCIARTYKGNAGFALETNALTVDENLKKRFTEEFPLIEEILSIGITSKMYKNFFPVVTDFWEKENG